MYVPYLRNVLIIGKRGGTYGYMVANPDLLDGSCVTK